MSPGFDFSEADDPVTSIADKIVARYEKILATVA
jgi:hypothetical protein